LTEGKWQANPENQCKSGAEQAHDAETIAPRLTR
jgi:hypothetical protein